MKIGYKATNKDFKCKEYEYNLHSVFEVTDHHPYKIIKSDLQDEDSSRIISSIEPEYNNNLIMCTKEVIHYCNNLEDCFQWYPSKDDRFFKVEILGAYKDDHNNKKSCTTKLRFLEEVSKEEIQNIKDRKEQDRLDKALNLDKVREIQKTFPNIILGGSLALYLHGAKLKRVEENYNNTDLDLIHPYYINLEEVKGIDHIDSKGSGADFHDTCNYDGVKIDLCIDPHTRYDVIEHKGHKYKVNKLETILFYKCKYAMAKGGEKHSNDIKELLGLNTNNNVPDDLPY